MALFGAVKYDNVINQWAYLGRVGNTTASTNYPLIVLHFMYAGNNQMSFWRRQAGTASFLSHQSRPIPPLFSVHKLSRHSKQSITY